MIQFNYYSYLFNYVLFLFYNYRFRGSELPLDKVGLFSNTTIGWLNEYLTAGYVDGMREKILPRLSQQETCDVNGPR